MNKIQAIYYARIIFGAILFPVFLTLFMLDRFFLVFYVWKESTSLHKWLHDPKLSAHSLSRVVATFALIGIIKLISLFL